MAINRFTAEDVRGMSDDDLKATVPTSLGGKTFVQNVVTASSGRLLGVQLLTAFSGTATPTAGTRQVRLRMIGGGGGGGAAASSSNTGVAAGSGGSSGVLLEIWIKNAEPLTYGAYKCGAGGARGTAGVGAAADGGAGGDTTIVINGRTYIAKGGSGGLAMLRIAGRRRLARRATTWNRERRDHDLRSRQAR